MPLYEYCCSQCGVRFEKIQKFSDPPLETCEQCGGKVDRLLSTPAIQFKGTGWYVTDYARKTPAESSAAPAGSSDGKGDQASPAKAEKSDTTAASSSKEKKD